MNDTSVTELDGLFQRELQTVNNDVRRKAALAAFEKLRPSNAVTVEQFLNAVQRHSEMWAAVSTLGIVEFAESLVGEREPALAEPRPQRTRMNDAQKEGLKNAVLRVLEGQAAGLNRIEITAAIIVAGLVPQGIDRSDLADKLRQPLHELAAESKLHTVGEKRLMKYLFGPGGKKAKQ